MLTMYFINMMRWKEEAMQFCRDGRVVKALDSKSNGIFPHRFESCSRRKHFVFFSVDLFDGFDQIEMSYVHVHGGEGSPLPLDRLSRLPPF